MNSKICMIKSFGDLIQRQWKLTMAIPPKMPLQNEEKKNIQQTNKQKNKQTKTQPKVNHGDK